MQNFPSCQGPSSFGLGWGPRKGEAGLPSTGLAGPRVERVCRRDEQGLWAPWSPCQAQSWLLKHPDPGVDRCGPRGRHSQGGL